MLAKDPFIMLRPPQAVWRRSFTTIRPPRLINQMQRRTLFNRSQPEAVTYRIRLRKPPVFTTKNVSRKIIRYAPILILVYYFTSFSVVFVDDDSEKEAMAEDGSLELHDEEEYEDDDEDDSLLFLPLGFPKLRPKVFYRGSDPTWQEYIKLSKNKDRQKRIFGELVRDIRQSINDHPHLNQVVGNVDMKKGRHWLDVVFAHGPPKTYEQLGILVTTSYIAIVTKELSEQEYIAQARLFNLSAVYDSVKTSCSQVYNMITTSLRELPGSNRNSSEPSTFPVKFGQSKTSSTAAGVPIAADDSPQQTPDSNPSDASAAESAGHHSPMGPFRPPESNSKRTSPHGQLLSTVANTFTKDKRGVDLPLGCVFLTGLVECHGTRANMTVDVNAAYNLFEDRFVMVNASARRIAEHRQRPMGDLRKPPGAS